VSEELIVEIARSAAQDTPPEQRGNRNLRYQMVLVSRVGIESTTRRLENEWPPSARFRAMR
jgi:hypothetical protein